jgi:hypothetical protein
MRTYLTANGPLLLTEEDAKLFENHGWVLTPAPAPFHFMGRTFNPDGSEIPNGENCNTCPGDGACAHQDDGSYDCVGRAC